MGLNIIDVGLKFKPLSYGNTPKFCVLHHAEASHCSIQDIHSWHLQNGWAGCGYHFLVRKDGTVYRGRPENAIGAHCPSRNSDSIGICAEGEYMGETMPEVQKQAIVALCQEMCQKYGKLEIGGHKQYYSTSCPGDKYPLAEIKNRVNGANISVNYGGVQMDNTVLTIQRQLNAMEGARLAEDGIMGAGTLQAIKNFQAKYGLSVDGVWGAQSANKMNQLYAQKAQQAQQVNNVPQKTIEQRLAEIEQRITALEQRK
ncbi:peptidoglycan recognition protein family protein [Clostridium felsineum]|uniref:peptidoglycan recognition protein family protein n=1 Tax=Clostridium felsineum TaxID=36839 RepID=UPI00098CDAE5|nr:N-acetylmuramoyl-L-alanine amidase [Clostridium felsineum]URZ16849.1 hypothetical protein CLFE_028960 [Clostridium felsineum DSM 794]